MAKGQDPEEDVPFGFYKLVTIAPWFFATFMPVVCIVLLVLGILDLEVNDRISNIWKESAGKFYDAEEYRLKSEAIDGGASTMLAIAKERNNRNLFTAAKLGTIIDRMADVETNTNVNVTVGDRVYTFNYNDLCAVADIDKPYETPCIRITGMDMWQEAGYSWDKSYQCGAATPPDHCEPHERTGRGMQKWWFKQAVVDNFVAGALLYSAAGGALGLKQTSCEAPGLPRDPSMYPAGSEVSAIVAFINLDACSQCYKDAEAELLRGTQYFSGVWTQTLNAQLAPATVTITTDHVKNAMLVQLVRGLIASSVERTLSYSALGLATFNSATINNTTMPAGYLPAVGLPASPSMYDIIDGAPAAYADPTILGGTGGSASPFAALAVFGGNLDLQPDSTCVGTCLPVSTVDVQAGDCSGHGSMVNGVCVCDSGYFSATGAPCGVTATSSCTACVVPTTGLPLGYTGTATSNPVCQASNNFGHLNVNTMPPTSTGDSCLAYMSNLKWYSAVAAQLLNPAQPYDVSIGGAKSDGTASGYYLWALDFFADYVARNNVDRQTFMRAPNTPTNLIYQEGMLTAGGAKVFYSDSGDPYRIQIGQNLNPFFSTGRIKFTGQTDAEILKLGAGNIYNFDEGVSLGNVSKFITLGGTDPAIGQYSCYNSSREYDVYNARTNGHAWAASCTNPLDKVVGVQTLYIIMRPKYIKQRVANSERPGGAINITEDDAKKVMKEFKEKFEKRWTDGNGTSGKWDDSSTDVQFLAFFDDAGEAGSFSRALDDVTNSGALLTLISYIVLFLVSVLLLLNCKDRQHSRMVAGAFGTILSILAFLGAIGITALAGKQLQIVQMWTLPFLMVGIGVDDMYIITIALNKTYSTSAKSFVETMNDKAVPVTMTSLTNLGIFAIMTMVTIPAVYESAYTAMYAIGLLYLTMLTAYPAVMYLDLKRQEGTCAVSCLSGKAYKQPDEPSTVQGLVYTTLYKPVLDSKIFHAVVLLISAGLVGVSAYACTDFDIGVGIKEFAQEGTQLRAWAEAAESTFPTWPMSMSWGDVDYRDPETQLHIVKQFEGVLDTAHVDFQKDTDKDLWMGSLQIWGSQVCDNGAGDVCGADFPIPSSVTNNSRTCTTTWIKTSGPTYGKYSTNKYSDYDIHGELMYTGSANTTIVGLDTAPGVCVTGRRLAGVSAPGKNVMAGSCVSGNVSSDDYDSKFCPVFAHSTSGVCADGVCADVTPYTWQELQFCMGKWREEESGGSYNYKSYAADGITRTSDEPQICDGAGDGDFTCRAGETPTGIKVTTSGTMFAINLTSHDKYVKMIEDAREVCDDDETAPWYSDSSVQAGCWVRGIPVDFWSQYLGIESFLLKICGYAVAAGVVVSQLFMLGDLLVGVNSVSTKSCPSKLLASWIGGLLIGLVCAMTLVTVIGLSTLLGVNLTVFSIMSYMMSVGYAVEYSVHIVHRFMTAPVELESSLERTHFTMDSLFMPCFMAFVSSTIGIIVMAFSELTFVRKFFFTPLFTCMLVTYWYGIFFLPVFLQYCGFQCMYVGPEAAKSRRASLQAFVNQGGL